MLINIPFDYLNLLITRILLDFGSYLIIKPFWQATIFPLFLVGGNDPWIIPGHTIKCICFDPLTLIIKANVFGNGMGYFDTVMLTGRRVRNRGKQDSLFVVFDLLHSLDNYAGAIFRAILPSLCGFVIPQKVITDYKAGFRVWSSHGPLLTP